MRTATTQTSDRPIPARPWIRRGAAIGAVVTLLLFAASTFCSTRLQIGPDHHLDLDRWRIAYETRPPSRPSTRPWLSVRRAESYPRADWLAPDYHFYSNGWFIRLPLWIPLVLFAMPLGMGLIRRRRRHGICGQCGYRLEGLPRGRDASIVCPECGSEQTP